MHVRPVDERDARLEIEAAGYRVVLLDGGSVTAFDVDAATPAQAQEWAERNRGDAVFALAARVPDAEEGLTLVWLVPPPAERSSKRPGTPAVARGDV